MKKPATIKALETLGRVRLSEHFFMRDFLHSEIADFYGIPNIPHYPDIAIEAGTQLCQTLLEPLKKTFGHIAIRSSYRSPEVNDFGNKNDLNCATNQSNYGYHIWDYKDRDGCIGATACIAIPWVWDRYQESGDWQRLAWWIHDHLDYASMGFYPKLWALNLQWHQVPTRTIKSFANPKGTLTKPGMDNHTGDHSAMYPGFPALVR